MIHTTVSVLTPAGTGAIASVAVTGLRTWGLARRLFRPAGSRPLPDHPELHRFWFGTLGEGTGDEVILAVKQVNPEVCIEVHCHGGRRVVRWVVEQFLAGGCSEAGVDEARTAAFDWLTRAPTLRTAAILLDQFHGAFDRAVHAILAHLGSSDPGPAVEPLEALARLAPLGRHLVEPWKVVIAGPPNVGKSSLMNALAGYQRSVVSAVAGTTRDVVTTQVAFEGWPVELADTAGLRDAAGLEAEGIDRAKQLLAEANLVVWLFDGTEPNPVRPSADEAPPEKLLRVWTKADLPQAKNGDSHREGVHVSALTGNGVAELTHEIAHRLVPVAPSPGAAVPYTPTLASRITAAHTAFQTGLQADAVALLRATLAPG